MIRALVRFCVTRRRYNRALRRDGDLTPPPMFTPDERAEIERRIAERSHAGDEPSDVDKCD